jgi:cytochrome c biogenesis protein CcdA/thiol-disulfide isomerase/thioredoxin
MTLFLLAYLGGVLTILSPCILPVLPFVFARADQPFVKSGLPLLAGMAVTFAAVATLAAVGGAWAVQANEYGRIAAFVLLAVFGITLLVPAIAEWLTRPVVAAGAWLSQRAHAEGRAGSPILLSFLLGIATGFLWAPCAGPILGLILTGAALEGANSETSLLLLAYAAGAATSLALALLLGGRVFAAMKRSLGAGEWIRRGLGIAVLAGVAAIALGLDTGYLTRLSIASTSNYEQSLLDLAPGVEKAQPSVIMGGGPGMMMSGSNAMMSGNAMTGAPAMTGTPAMAGGAGMMSSKAVTQNSDALPVEGALPPLSGATAWLNSPPLTQEGLRGKVVLVDFWTYSCINCLRAIPYVRAWAEKYKDQGLVVIGVHSPEFAFEKNIDNVRRAVHDLKIDYPVAIDNAYAIWRAFGNQYWPAHYFIDTEGRIRHHHFGEGDYEESEQVIRALLAEAGKGGMAGGLVSVNASGVEAAADLLGVQSPETYVGYERTENFASPGGTVRDMQHDYSTPPALEKNQWALGGDWTVESEKAVLDGPSGRIVFRFHARDLHLVLGPAPDGKPVRFKVSIDGAPPGADHGSDTDIGGNGVVNEQRLYQLVRQGKTEKDRTFEIEFLDPGAEAFAFTFG